MKVLLIRHFKVDHAWKRHCTSKEYDEELFNYNLKPVIETKPLDSSINTVYISTLTRTAQTAKHLTGEKTIIQTALVNEVDLRGSTRLAWRMPITLRSLLSFIKWRVNYKKQNESSKQTRLRAHNFLKMIEQKGDDCIVVSHGLFLMVLMDMMIQKSFKCNKKDKRFRNGEIAELTKLH
jgi:broad specificity phosphatase PhoE